MDKIKEMEEYAQKYDVPIMQKDGIEFLCRYIQEHHVKNILEIGSAIGYSSICMALADPEVHIVTMERDEERCRLAEKNIKEMHLQDRITLLKGDALELEVTGSFDLLFIDAAKAQYIKFFERYEPLLQKNGTIVSDNLKFHGYVDHPENIQSRNLRQLVRKIQRFITYLENRSDYETRFYEIGDGIAITRKKV